MDGISHVFNFDLPNEPETYVHRIGRTAAWRHGQISFCDAAATSGFLRDIEKLIKKQIRGGRTYRNFPEHCAIVDAEGETGTNIATRAAAHAQRCARRVAHERRRAIGAAPRASAERHSASKPGRRGTSQHSSSARGAPRSTETRAGSPGHGTATATRSVGIGRSAQAGRSASARD